MGIRDWARRVTDPVTDEKSTASPTHEPSHPPLGGPMRGADDAALEPQLRVEVRFGPDWHAGEPVKMSGTTTVAAAECRYLFALYGRPDGGRIEAPATLVAEHREGQEQPVVAVHVDQARVGYLPSSFAAQLNPDNGALDQAATVASVQMWGTPDGGEDGNSLRVIGWVAAGPGPVTWPHDDNNPAAVTILEQRAEAAAGTADMVREALEGDDPRRASQFRRGLVNGRHYLETVEPIKQLKREGKLDEALELCYAAIEGAEADRDGREPAPWYTEQAAIIHRKRGEYAQEVAVLRRWLDACPGSRRAGSTIQQRLDKLTS